jgi:homoserine kinase
MSGAEFVTAFAPASIGNVGVGYDILGLAITGVGDRVAARKTETGGVTIREVRGLDGEIHPYLSPDSDANTASIAAKALWTEHGDSSGIELIVHKGVPLQSGMGSSAASAVAGVVAVNALLDEPLQQLALLPYALEGEKYASGGALHADNVAPSLIGGLVFCPKALLPQAYSLPAPEGISSVLVHPMARAAKLPGGFYSRLRTERSGSHPALPQGCDHRAAAQTGHTLFRRGQGSRVEIECTG